MSRFLDSDVHRPCRGAWPTLTLTSSDDCRARAAPGRRSLVVVASLYNFPAIHTNPRPLMIS